jgi:hypothetical protein
MITTEVSPDDGTSRRVHGQPSRKGAKIVVPAILLTSVFLFTGAPSATAAALTNSNMPASWEPPPCRGDKPGICPYYYLNHPDRQITNQLDRQHTTSESPMSR